MEGEEDATIIRNVALGNLARREPPRRGEDSQTPENRGASKLHHESIRGGGVILPVPFDRDPVKKKLAIAGDGDSMTVWAKGSKEDVMMFSVSVEAMLAIECQDKVLSWTSGPLATK